MRPTLIKICGITRVEDGVAAIDAGADWLGFIRWPASPRFRPIGSCADLLKAIRAEAAKPFEAVGVYVDAGAREIVSEIEAAGFDRVQLHGSEPVELLNALPVPAIKTIKVRDEASLAQADAYPDVDILTDTADPLMPGGTGRGYDVNLLIDLARRRRIIVAGGLNPDNVAEVIRTVSPYGVDVSSGVETSPGNKDRGKIERFIRAARGEAS